MAIELKTVDWGEARSEDVLQVLKSTKDVMDTAFGGDIGNDIWVFQNLNRGNPVVLFERGPHGEYKIELNVTDRYWAKYAYQFSHEYCHLRTNYDGGSPQTKWFEEVICELCSIYALRRMSAVWAVNPPYSNWQIFSGSLSDYAETIVNNPKYQLPAGTEFSSWLQTNRPELEADPYLREKNTTIALQLLPLFEQNPSLWFSLALWNKWDNAIANDISECFKEWKKLILPENKASCELLVEMFQSPIKT